MTALEAIEYRAVKACPSCRSPRCHEVDRLDQRIYHFGRVDIALPPGGIALMRCEDCTLVFKDAVPTDAALSEVMTKAANDVWADKPGAHPHAGLLAGLAEGRDSVLDIGAANGDVLRALAGPIARRSAYDIIRYPACEPHVSGEYIIGHFEGQVETTGESYDLVTAFDVFEHFSDARQAFDNIARFVGPTGVLLIETGDSDLAYPRLGQWYYARLFEHTIFWNRKSLELAAMKSGLRLESFQTVNHKGRIALSFVKRPIIWLIHVAGLIGVAANSVRSAAGLHAELFGSPFRKDHMLAWLIPA